MSTGEAARLKNLQGAAAIAEVTATGREIEVAIPANTKIPDGAEYLLVYSINSAGESEAGEPVSGFDKGSTVTLSITNNNADISSIDLVISGANMTPVTQSLAGTATSTVIEVPNGTARTFTATANVNPAAGSIFLSFFGSETDDLSAGIASNVAVTIDQIDDMKILIPDYQNYRMVQIDNMAGDNWTEILYSGIGFAGSYLRVYDIDYDADGKIYFANRAFSTGYNRVFVLDDINDTSATGLPDQSDGIDALAVDRTNGIVYYSDGTNLWKCDLDGGNPATLSLAATTINTITGIDADRNGMLYMVGTNDSAAKAVFRYDPSTETETAHNAYSGLTDPWDIVVKDSAVYVANNQGGTGFQILQFSTSLGYVAGYGAPEGMPSSDPESTNFFGPHRFLAVPARKIRLADENGSSSSDAERIVSFDDITGSSWETFNPGDVGESPFSFFEQY